MKIILLLVLGVIFLFATIQTAASITSTVLYLILTGSERNFSQVYAVLNAHVDKESIKYPYSTSLPVITTNSLYNRHFLVVEIVNETFKYYDNIIYFAKKQEVLTLPGVMFRNQKAADRISLQPNSHTDP